MIAAGLCGYSAEEFDAHFAQGTSRIEQTGRCDHLRRCPLLSHGKLQGLDCQFTPQNTVRACGLSCDGVLRDHAAECWTCPRVAGMQPLQDRRRIA